MRILLPALIVMFAVSAAHAAACEDIRGLSLPGAAITLSESVPAGGFTLPGGPGARGADAFKALPSFCRVAATLTPTRDSEIKIEVWLRESGWNGKLQSVGNGAWAGTISYPAMATALAAGYAAASTDTGHTGNNANFIPGHPEKVIDFGYRAVHEMTVAAKAIIAARYGNGPRYSYFTGCSTGGRQALMEAQRYPGDYDGILAGAPAIYASRLQGMQVWAAQTAHRDQASSIPPAKYSVLNSAVLQQCDALDGVKDGVLEDPTACKSDPKVLVCKDGDALSCLTAAQAETAARLYAGPRSSRTGEPLFPGLQRGSELGWNTLAGPQPMSLANEMYKLLVFDDPNWDFKTINPDSDFERAEKVLSNVMDATNHNLQPFFDRRGKLIMYHGWNDPGIPPMNTVQYYQKVTGTLGGPAKTSNSMRLFMIPGMNHCQGGVGTDRFDGLAALVQWVEDGKAPDRIHASHQTGGKVDRRRPLCPYPQVAAYRGSGSTDEAANFACK